MHYMKEYLNKIATKEDNDEVGEILRKYDWKDIFSKSKPIEGSIEGLEELINCNDFEIAILTHCNSHNEVKWKIKTINKYIPGIKLIPVFKPTSKSIAVDPRGAVLIDDYSKNLIEWKNAGGISIKFSSSNNINKDFYSIKSLLQAKDTVKKIITSNEINLAFDNIYAEEEV